MPNLAPARVALGQAALDFDRAAHCVDIDGPRTARWNAVALRGAKKGDYAESLKLRGRNLRVINEDK